MVFIHIHALKDVQSFSKDGRAFTRDRSKLEDQVDEGKSYLTQQIIPRNPSVSDHEGDYLSGISSQGRSPHVDLVPFQKAGISQKKHL